MKCTTKRLIEAAHLLGLMFKAEVTGIQFEDGSGYKFNYQLEGSAKWKYIDLSAHDLRPHYDKITGVFNKIGA